LLTTIMTRSKDASSNKSRWCRHSSLFGHG
jgi:hypothetical protein